MSDKVLAYISTPILVGDLVALLNGESAGDFWLGIDDAGVLMVCR